VCSRDRNPLLLVLEGLIQEWIPSWEFKTTFLLRCIRISILRVLGPPVFNSFTTLGHSPVTHASQARYERSVQLPFGGATVPPESPSRQPLQQMQNSLYLLPTSSNASFQSVPSANDSLRIPPSHSAPDMLALHMQHSLRMSDQLESTNSSTTTAVFGVRPCPTINFPNRLIPHPVLWCKLQFPTI
jgi:hypothetical protein